MMTGKNLRPLIEQGIGFDSDTFAGILRTYGYRTAAFYPPAVFFIDEELFVPFRDRKLDFEYARVEFADPHERARAVRGYLETQPRDHRVFLWVHLFEPHEPYVPHPEHAFGERDIDRYDSEVALADEGVGEIVAAVRARQPGAVVIVTADHGEEFGEHHGRYHGTTVYEEQVRVPLVVSAPGVAARRIEAPVQTIDILPSVLAALDIPLPPRIWGRSLGPWLARGAPPSAPGPPVAFAVTDDQAMLAEGEWRLVCARRAGACALYDLDLDPGETRDVSSGERERFAAMKASLRHVEASQGVYESAGARADGGKSWPEPIRRGLAGDGDAAREIAALLDDSEVTFRRKAAELLFDLKRKEAAPELRLALSSDGRPGAPVLRRRAARRGARRGRWSSFSTPMRVATPSRLALAEMRRGGAVLVSGGSRATAVRARATLAALGQIRRRKPRGRSCAAGRRAIAALHRRDPRLDQPSARGPLADDGTASATKCARVAAAALVRLGAKRELIAPLVRFPRNTRSIAGGSTSHAARACSSVGGPSATELARVAARCGRRPREARGSARGQRDRLRILVRASSTDGHRAAPRAGARLSGIEPAGRKKGSRASRPGEGARRDRPASRGDARVSGRGRRRRGGIIRDAPG
jgi:hypothetical protein